MNRFVNFDSNRIIGNVNTNIKAAVFAYMYYTDDFESYISYLSNIPSHVDLYIMTPNLEIKQKTARLLGDKAVCLDTINRGRDIASLLVVAAKYTQQYDYFCFIHDKKAKTDGQIEFAAEWNYMMWESMLASESYICQILDYFDNNDKMGALFPPKQNGRYSAIWYSGSWGINYDNTVELANRIGLNIEIDMADEPASLGTVFWARTDALHKLMQYGWTIEDFPAEPLPDDGAINHAVERILPYVADDCGYEYANCTTSEYMNKYLEYTLDAFRRAGDILDKEYGIHSQEMVDEYFSRKKKVLEYTAGKSRVYIYGAGRVGKACKRYLESIRVVISAFVVTQSSSNTTIDGIEVIGIKNARIDDDAAVIIAARTDIKKEMIETLKQYGKQDYIEYI